MSIRTLANTRGQTVKIKATTASTDSVGGRVISYGSATEHKAYVADDGGSTAIIQGRQEAPRSIRVYIPGNVSVTLDDRLEIGDVIYEVTSVTQPGMRTNGPLAFTAIGAVSNEVAY
tara:strand:- start:359 stop:709 length:351 start_codon:yes stop_codon:yes gene_type:complete